MKIFSYILGIILIIGGVACLFRPGATFLSTGYFMAIMLLISGIIGIVNVIKKFVPALTLVMSIPAVIIGVIAIFRPGSTLLIDALMIYLFAGWFAIQGIIDIIIAVRAKGVDKGWYWKLIIGILSILISIYSFVHPTVSALAIGILIGIYLIEAGLSIITLASGTRNAD